ncbi:MAG: endonuclease/exonuclease/phosphatase [Chitinophagaceae bacterium]
MKKIYCGLLALMIFSSKKSFSQASANALDVLSWNIEWFGSATNGPADLNLQEANVKKILRYIDADLMGFCEVVDTMRFRRVVDSLGSNYGFKISDYCSNNTTGTGNSWLTGQKLAFIYKKDMFSNLVIRGLGRNSPAGYTNWASGRFPYLLTADVTIAGVTKNMSFIMIHGKSGNTASDYQKRFNAATELKDTLDTYFSNKIVLIIGDYNDALNHTISSGAGPESSYYPIVVDSTDSDHWKSITMPLANAGQTSMINFPNVIDNHIISNECEPLFVPVSAWIRTDVTNVVPNYTTNNTSDHWPVFSQYFLNGFVASVPDVTASALGIKVFPNPFSSQICLQTTKSLTDVKLQLVDMNGRVVYKNYYRYLQAGSRIEPAIITLKPGAYFIHLQTKNSQVVMKVIKTQIN